MSRNRDYSIELRKLERYGDPRECQVDVNAPVREIAGVIDTGMYKDPMDEPERVMPLRDFNKFVRLIHNATETFDAVDDSHFWVSGYYAVYFESKKPIDRKRMKSIVQNAVKESGGFMTVEEWGGARENRKGGNMLEASGTGSNISWVSNIKPAYL